MWDIALALILLAVVLAVVGFAVGAIHWLIIIAVILFIVGLVRYFFVYSGRRRSRL